MSDIFIGSICLLLLSTSDLTLKRSRNRAYSQLNIVFVLAIVVVIWDVINRRVLQLSGYSEFIANAFIVVLSATFVVMGVVTGVAELKKRRGNRLTVGSK